MKRRNFLKLVACAPVALALPPPQPMNFCGTVIEAGPDYTGWPGPDRPVGFVLDSSRLDSGDYLVSHVTV